MIRGASVTARVAAATPVAPSGRLAMPHPVTLSRALLVAPLLGALLLVSSVQAVAQDLFRGWGTYRFDTEAFAAPAVGVAAYGHGYAVLRTDGRVIVQGLTSLAEAPGPPPGVQYTAIAISTSSPSPWGLALQSDGQVTVWGPGGLPAPALPVGVRYVQISAGHAHSVALRSDGVAVAWGQNSYGQTTLPTVPPGVTVLQVQAGTYATLLRLSNGTIVGSLRHCSAASARPDLQAALGWQWPRGCPALRWCVRGLGQQGIWSAADTSAASRNDLLAVWPWQSPQRGVAIG